MTRAQSSTIGFVFVFSLIVVTVGTVYAGAVPALQSAQDAERVNNVERAFDVLSDNVNDVTRSGAPSRATEVKLAGGSLEITEATRIELEVVNSSDANHNASFGATTRPITYREGDTTVALAHGAVLRGEEDGSTMRTEPDWLVDENRAVIPLVVTTRSNGPVSLGGDTTVLVVTQVQSRGVQGSFTTGPDSTAIVNITVESPRAAAWNRYLDSLSVTGSDPPDDDPTDGTVTYQFETDAVYVPRTSIGVELAG